MDRFERFSFAMFEASRCWHKLADEELNKVGLKGAYATYLTTLFQYPDGITSAELSKKCIKDKADTSRAVNLFEKKGIVIKKKVCNQRQTLIFFYVDRFVSDVL